MKTKIFFLLKFCELGSKVQNKGKILMFMHPNRIEPSSILVQNGSIQFTSKKTELWNVQNAILNL